MKIVLAALNAKYVHSNLAVYTLQAYAKRQLNGLDKAEIVVREYTINHNLDAILSELYREKAEVVAFSCYIWNIKEILTIAKELSKVSPSTHIWLGGPEVSYDSKTLLEQYPFVEGVMRGEGEQTFYELVKYWCATDKELKNVAGITYRDCQGVVWENVTRPLMLMDDVPFVYNDLSLFDNKIVYYETSRGCPFSCSYCLSSIDKSVRFRSIHLVERELQFFLDHQIPQVKFIDRTFNCKKEHALAIWNYIAKHDNGVTNFHFEVSADLIGEEELTLFEGMRPGLIQLEIGLQTTNPKTIREIRRSMDIKRLQSNMFTIRSYGNIHQHLDLIAGLPYEDFKSFTRSFNDAYAMKPNQLQLGFLKVLKGSYMEEQVAEYGLQYQETQPYEVLCNKWVSYDELLQLKLVEEMVEVYYNSDQFEHVLAYLIPFFETPYAFYEALGVYYQRENLFGIGFKREARYQALRDFAERYFVKTDDVVVEENIFADGDAFSWAIFDSLLTYDYYLRENAKSRPAWSTSEPIEKSVYHNFFKNGGNSEVSLEGENYDSKVAARIMHIEPVVREATEWITDGCMTIQDWEYLGEVVYCLFDYEHRNPLTRDADVRIMTRL